MDSFLMKPKVDFAFKEIMIDEKARSGFLSAVLRLDPADIKETQILNTYLRKVHPEDKQGILDVRILLNNSVEIDVEIQLSEMAAWTARSLFYAAKMYTDQLEQGQDYSALKKCVSISILNFVLFEGEAAYYSCFHIREDTRHTLYSDMLEFHAIELPKLPQEHPARGDRLLQWAKFINAERKEEFDMLAEQNEDIASAYQRLQVISQDKQKRMEYDARQKAILDYNQGIKEAIERGEKRGKDEERLTIARNLILQGTEMSVITAATGLTEEQVESLK